MLAAAWPQVMMLADSQSDLRLRPSVKGLPGRDSQGRPKRYLISTSHAPDSYDPSLTSFPLPPCEHHITQEEAPDIPAWNIERATQRLSEDQSCGNTRGTLTRHPMNISQVYRECLRHGTSKEHSFDGT